MVFSKWYVLAHDKFKRNKIKSAVKWLWVMALMKWQQNKQKCVTWQSWKAKVNWVHLLDSIPTKTYYNMCKQQTECHWCGRGMSLTLLRSGCQESPELCCVPMGYFWGCNQSIFWPQPCNRKHVTSCTLRPPAAAFTQETHKCAEPHTQPHLGQSVTAGGEGMSKKGEEHVSNRWAHGLGEPLYLFSREVSVRLNALCSVTQQKWANK